MSLGIAFIAALYYWFAWWDMGMVGNITTNCTFIGFIFGVILGDVTTGIIIGATINSMYLSTVAAGGNLPNDPALACCIALPIALTTGLDTNAAVALSIPFAVLGTFLDNIRRTLNVYWSRRAPKDARALNIKMFKIDAMYGPIATQFIVRVPIITAVLFLLGSGADAIMSSIPAWVMAGFTAIGGMLPGMGMVLCATMIGRTELLPFFVMGFFLFEVSGVSLVVLAILAAMVAIVYVMLAFPKSAVTDDDEDDEEEEQIATAEQHLGGAFDTAFQIKTAMRVLFFHRFSNNMESQFGPSLCNALYPALKRIYGDDKEGLAEALERHTQPYISEMTWGNVIMGVVLAMEEQKKAGAPISGEDITAVKSGLMGPFAGFGDSLNWATIAPLIRGLFLPFGMSGSFIGVLMEPCVRLYAIVLGGITFHLGYTRGRDALTDLLQGGWFEKVMTGAGVMGMFMLGVMANNYTSITLAPVITLATGEFVLNDLINSVVPGLLPFILVMSTFAYLKKGGSFIKALLFIVVLCFVCAFLGIF
ncbi:PTS system mannose/fructose/sorbose family transporter subunit IID [uncultured Enorma sp.]|jgi:mannose/fructose/N-acetylgalactosamine-specific phosphotransferase system component IID/mannose/fructose/N-acetylgalactosamine-specific phosphotransferase system component IIC|uniref:PTS system mannose/fructose/sorbose family transporter subunit IID n=1 Tax=uncultured Enorma sp. TaxID=1714346 RepID=UPI0025E225EA|nr:PTS system mannose/fructose/sorbose family transporter subunit IID [uncultured Enorma sp.]